MVDFVVPYVDTWAQPPPEERMFLDRLKHSEEWQEVRTRMREMRAEKDRHHTCAASARAESAARSFSSPVPERSDAV